LPIGYGRRGPREGELRVETVKMNSGTQLRRMCVLLSAVTLLTAACSAEPPGADPGKDKASGFEPLDKSVVVGVDELNPPPEVEGDIFIGVTFPHFRDPYWIAEAWGVKKRADELGVRVEITNAGGYGQTQTQFQQIEDFITQGIDALILGAVDAQGVAPAVDRAWSQGIPVVFANSLANSETQVGVYTNDCAVGRLQADYIAKHDPDARIVMFSGPPGVAWPKARSDCFTKRIEELAPRAEILTEKFHDMDEAVVLETMQDVLQTFPEIDYVYNNTDLQAKGVVDALRAAGHDPGEIKVTHLTIGREAWELLKRGWTTMGIAEQPVLQGALAVDMATRILGREEVPAKWEVEHPTFTTDQADEFRKKQSQWDWEPLDFRP
jgi:protein TorT